MAFDRERTRWRLLDRAVPRYGAGATLAAAVPSSHGRADQGS